MYIIKRITEGKNEFLQQEGWGGVRKTARTFEYMSEAELIADCYSQPGVCIEPATWNKNNRKWNFAHFPAGTVVKVAEEIQRIYNNTEFTVAHVSKNGPDSYVITTDAQGVCTEFASFNIDHVEAIISRGTGKTGLHEHVAYPSVYERGLQKHHSRYASRYPNGLVYDVAAQFITNDMQIDIDALSQHLVATGVLQHVSTEYLFQADVSANKKKLKRAIRRCINRFCVNHRKSQKDEDAYYADSCKESYASCYASCEENIDDL